MTFLKNALYWIFEGADDDTGVTMRRGWSEQARADDTTKNSGGLAFARVLLSLESCRFSIDASPLYLRIVLLVR
jgi:hypothetical protein